MADKISKHLTMAERFVLLGILPQADFVTYKILRKLKDTLSPSEEEIISYNFVNKYVCPHKEYDGKGGQIRCEYTELGKEAGSCPIHKEGLQAMGDVAWATEKWQETKEVFFGLKANELIVAALKKADENTKKGNSDVFLALFEKFGDAEEGE